MISTDVSSGSFSRRSERGMAELFALVFGEPVAKD